MLTIAPALVVASLIALVGSLVAASALAIQASLRPAPLGVAQGHGGTASAPASATSPEIGAAWIVHVGALLALVFLVAALALRALAVGHAPWSNLHEVSQAFAAAVLAAYLALERRFAIRSLAPAASMVAALLVVYALTLPATVQPLVPALQQPVLLTVHVAAALVAYGIYAVAFVVAAAELVQTRFAGGAAWLPPASVARAAAHRAVILGYPVLTAAIVLGAVWANLAWRSYWNNDPKELTAAATWLIYGAYLHVAGRRDGLGRLAPWFIVAGFGAILLTYFGANLLFPGQHSYTGL